MALLIFVFVSSGWAADLTKAKELAQTCVACHGPAGLSSNSLWPNLAGQKLDYVVKQLKHFRDGERTDPLMSPVSKMLSDQDIADLAAYYAQMRPQ